MDRLAVWLVVGFAALAAVGLVYRLWRLRHDAEGRWTTQDYLTALGLVVALLVVALPLLLARDNATDDPDVAAYRQEVRAACAGLQPTTNPMMEAINPDGTFDRARLEQGLRNQVTAAQGVLAALWARTPPDSLADTLTNAQTAADTYVQAVTNKLDQMAIELPVSISFTQLATYIGAMDAQLRPSATQFESAMSQLADGPCRAPSASLPS